MKTLKLTVLAIVLMCCSSAAWAAGSPKSSAKTKVMMAKKQKISAKLVKLEDDEDPLICKDGFHLGDPFCCPRTGLMVVLSGTGQCCCKASKLPYENGDKILRECAKGMAEADEAQKREAYLRDYCNVDDQPGGGGGDGNDQPGDGGGGNAPDAPAGG